MADKLMKKQATLIMNKMLLYGYLEWVTNTEGVI